MQDDEVGSSVALAVDYPGPWLHAMSKSGEESPLRQLLNDLLLVFIADLYFRNLALFDPCGDRCALSSWELCSDR